MNILHEKLKYIFNIYVHDFACMNKLANIKVHEMEISITLSHCRLTIGLLASGDF